MVAANPKKVDFIALLAANTFRQFAELFGFMRVRGRMERLRMWPMQCELADMMDKFKMLWQLKARQLGASENAGLYSIFVAITEPNSDIVIISKKMPDAEYFLRRRIACKLRALETDPALSQLPWPKWEIGEKKIRFSNGSEIIAVSSSNDEVRSMTCRLVIFDEAREFSHNDANELWSAMLPAISEQRRGQIIVMSTAKFGSWFNDMSHKILQKKISGIKLFFMPATSHPDRTPKWFAEQRGKWPNDVIFRREYPLTIADCFAAREGAVYASWDDNPGGSHVRDIPLDWNWRFMVGLDWGFDHPTVMLLALHNQYDDFLYIFDEVYCRHMEIDKVGAALRDKMAHWKGHGAPEPKRKIADTQIFANDGRRTIAETLRRISGLNFSGALKHDKEGSLALAQLRVANRRVAVHPRCVEFRKQITNLKYKVTADGRSLDEPEKIEDDGPDVFRYLCAEIHRVVKSTPKIPTDLEQWIRRSETRKRMESAIRSRDPRTPIPGETPWQAL